MYSSMRLPNIGLSPDPKADTPKTTYTTGQVVTLPYMGINPLDDAAARPYPTEELRFKSYADRSSVAEKSDDLDEPCTKLINRTTALARELRISEEQAEIILLSKQ